MTTTTGSPLRDYTFAVYPGFGDDDPQFDAFLLDVPGYPGEQDRAARRAYFTAMAHMAGRGFDVEDFNVAVWEDGKPGPPVGPGGIE